MAHYLHRCEVCAVETVVIKPMARCSEPATCDCGGATRMQFTAPRVNMQDWLYNDENRRAFGSVSKEELRAEDKAYERRRTTIVGPGVRQARKMQTLLEVHQELHGTSV